MASPSAARPQPRPSPRPTNFQAIESPHIPASILLQVAFGLRRKKAIKFRPQVAMRAEHITLHGSWTKGGRPRTVPIHHGTAARRHPRQRTARADPCRADLCRATQPLRMRDLQGPLASVSAVSSRNSPSTCRIPRPPRH
nr:integrase domain-containing protein [Rhizobium laguerreae]